jgi:hypothetical protein
MNIDTDTDTDTDTGVGIDIANGMGRTFRSSSTVKTVVKKMSNNSRFFARVVRLPSGFVSMPAICASAAV